MSKIETDEVEGNENIIMIGEENDAPSVEGLFHTFYAQIGEKLSKKFARLNELDEIQSGIRDNLIDMNEEVSGCLEEMEQKKLNAKAYLSNMSSNLSCSLMKRKKSEIWLQTKQNM